MSIDIGARIERELRRSHQEAEYWRQTAQGLDAELSEARAEISRLRSLLEQAPHPERTPS